VKNDLNTAKNYSLVSVDFSQLAGLEKRAKEERYLKHRNTLLTKSCSSLERKAGELGLEIPGNGHPGAGPKKENTTVGGCAEICGYVSVKQPCRRRVRGGGLCGHHAGKESARLRSAE
jgi:hypothetical protein